MEADVNYRRRYEEIRLRHLHSQTNHLPWVRQGFVDHEEQAIIRDVLRELCGARYFGDNVFISPDAHIHTHRFAIGDNSYVAAETTIRLDVTIGRNTTVNSYSHIAGTVIIGDEVMIASGVTIWGFNHSFKRRDIPMSQQPLDIKGVNIGDDVWIGSQAAILDGVTVGSHSIVGARAVVTKDVPAYAIVAGNPARIISMRP